MKLTAKTTKNTRWLLKTTRKAYSSLYASVFDDRIVLPNRSEISFTRIELLDFVSVVPLLNSNILMLEVFRYPLNNWSLETPSGHIEGEETPEECAQRELIEETGYVSRKLSRLGSYYPLARSTQQAHVYLAEELHKVGTRREQTENMKIRFFSLKKLREELQRGTITHAPTLIGLHEFMLSLKTCRPESNPRLPS